MKGKRADLSGKTIGAMEIISLVKYSGGKSYWGCKCINCGAGYIRTLADIYTGKETKYCGACKSEARVKHGDTKKRKGKTRLYIIWQNMIRRCDPKRCTKMEYKYYAGKGIRVISEWHEYLNFRTWALKSGYQDDLTIDRINGDDNYSPDNCHWADREYQAWNKKGVRKIKYNGEYLNLKQLSKICSISATMLYDRMFMRGWPIDKAMNTPRRGKAHA